MNKIFAITKILVNIWSDFISRLESVRKLRRELWATFMDAVFPPSSNWHVTAWVMTWRLEVSRDPHSRIEISSPSHRPESQGPTHAYLFIPPTSSAWAWRTRQTRPCQIRLRVCSTFYPLITHLSDFAVHLNNEEQCLPRADMECCVMARKPFKRCQR